MACDDRSKRSRHETKKSINTERTDFLLLQSHNSFLSPNIYFKFGMFLFNFFAIIALAALQINAQSSPTTVEAIREATSAYNTANAELLEGISYSCESTLAHPINCGSTFVSTARSELQFSTLY